MNSEIVLGEGNGVHVEITYLEPAVIARGGNRNFTLDPNKNYCFTSTLQYTDASVNRIAMYHIINNELIMDYHPGSTTSGGTTSTIASLSADGKTLNIRNDNTSLSIVVGIFEIGLVVG